VKFAVIIRLIYMQYIKHKMQITQEPWEYDLTTNPWNLCSDRLHHCQKVTTVFVT